MLSHAHIHCIPPIDPYSSVFPYSFYSFFLLNALLMPFSIQLASHGITVSPSTACVIPLLRVIVHPLLFIPLSLSHPYLTLISRSFILHHFSILRCFRQRCHVLLVDVLLHTLLYSLIPLSSTCSHRCESLNLLLNQIHDSRHEGESDEKEYSYDYHVVVVLRHDITESDGGE